MNQSPFSFDLQLTSEGIETARRQAEAHQAQRGTSYDRTAFPVQNPVEKRLENVRIPDLRKCHGAGIYMIRDVKHQRCYVGLASDFSARFFHGRDDCKTTCPPVCSCYGHINATPSTCRSHRIIASGRDFAVHILQQMDDGAEGIGQAEVDWFFLLKNHGFEMVNAEWALGAKGATGRPIVVLDIDTGSYSHFPTITAAANRLTYGMSGGAGTIGPMLVGEQNQKHGLAARYATVEEIELFQGREDVTQEIAAVASVVSWTDGLKRNSSLNWEAGPLRSEDIQQLRHVQRGSYNEGIQQTDYRGVSWHGSKHGWQCRAKQGAGGKQIWQTGPLSSWRDEHDAALHREREILKRGWQAFNQGPRHGSNANLLNERVPERLGKTLEDWENDS